MQLAFFDWSRIITKFTNWTLIITLTNLIATLLCTHGGEKTQPKLAAAHLTFELGIIMNIVTILLYWTLLHKSALKKYKGDAIRTLHQYTIHIFPAVGMLVNFCVTDVRMCPKHYVFILGISVAYCFTNFFTVKVLGSEPLYWFLDWKDYKSPTICLAICVTFTTAYIKLAEMTQSVKPFVPVVTAEL